VTTIYRYTHHAQEAKHVTQFSLITSYT